MQKFFEKSTWLALKLPQKKVEVNVCMCAIHFQKKVVKGGGEKPGFFPPLRHEIRRSGQVIPRLGTNERSREQNETLKD